MPADALFDAPPNSDAYRRQARRLRHIHAKSPILMHRALRDLAGREDAGSHQARPSVVRRVTRAPCASIASDAATEVKVAHFATSITDALDGPVLRYSQRLELLKEAKRLGLGRFHANLVIALVQERAGTGAVVRPLPQNRPGAAGPVALVIAVQLLVTIGAWFVLR